MSNAPTFGGFPLPEESDGCFDADSCEFNLWFRELDGESLPPNRVTMEMGEDESGLPEMRLYIYVEELSDFIALSAAALFDRLPRNSEDLVDLTALKEAIECNNDAGEKTRNRKIGFNVSPALHDTDGPVILVGWNFEGTESVHAITPMCPFDKNDLRHLAWLAKFETLPASVVYNRAQPEGFGAMKKMLEEVALEDYDYEQSVDFLNAIDGRGVEFEAFVRYGGGTLQFARQVQDIAQIISMPDNWYRREFDGHTGEQIARPVFWEAAARAYLDRNPRNTLR